MAASTVRTTPTTYLEVLYGVNRSREEIIASVKASIIRDETNPNLYRVPADSAIACVLVDPNKIKHYQTRLCTGLDGKEYIETIGRQLFDTIIAQIEEEIARKYPIK